MEYGILAVAVMATVTILLRTLPFLIFSRRQTPAYITYLGKYLPYAIMGMLVVYCLKGINFTALPFGIPELVSAAVVVLLHLWKRSTLLSIVSGTALYMVLIQLVF